MSESGEQPKGFRIVDRRRFAGEEQKAGAQEKAPRPEPAAPEPPPAGRAQGTEAGGAAGGERAGRAAAASAPGARGEHKGGAAGPTFLDLVGTLQFGAMANLGMIQMPDGSRPPVNLAAAKDSIDMLGILVEKTKGNLTQEESDVLTEGLYHIRMAYVAAVKAAAGPGGKAK